MISRKRERENEQSLKDDLTCEKRQRKKEIRQIAQSANPTQRAQTKLVLRECKKKTDQTSQGQKNQTEKSLKILFENETNSTPPKTNIQIGKNEKI